MNYQIPLLRQELYEAKNTDELYNDLVALEPKPVAGTAPEKQNGIEQKTAFLNGDIESPTHIYPKLEAYTADNLSQLGSVGKDLLDSINDPITKTIYKEFVDNYKLIGEMMIAMNDVRSAETEEEKAEASSRFMRFNIEKNGKPDVLTYESLLTEKADQVLKKEAVGQAKVIQSELAGWLPETILENIKTGERPDRYRPDPKTMEWMQGVVQGLYGDMLGRIPNQSSFSPIEVVATFKDIVDSEFGAAAEGWQFVLGNARAVNVKSNDKIIEVPENRESMTREKLSSLVVHEIGVHMLRSITGSETDLAPLASGLNGYYDTEEGLGVVMEQAHAGKFREAGMDHYISAGAAYYDNMNFRSMFEMKWRMHALENLDENGQITEEAINKSRNFAYGNVMRSLRGTDELPWFKDLAYYNGAVEVWKHLDSIKGDDFQLALLMQGKISTSKKHQRIILNSKHKDYALEMQ